MNKKGRNSVKNQLTSLINKKSINQHYHESKGLIDYKTIQFAHNLNLSTFSRDALYQSNHPNRYDNIHQNHHSINHNKFHSLSQSNQTIPHLNLNINLLNLEPKVSQKKKKISQEYSHLLELLNRYQKYYKSLLETQKQRYVSSYKQILESLKVQFNKGKQELQQKIKGMLNIFTLHRDKIFYEMKEIEHNEYVDQNYENKINRLKFLQIVQLQFLEVLPVNMDCVKKVFQKFPGGFYQNSIKEKYFCQMKNFDNKENDKRECNNRYISEVKNIFKEQSCQTQALYQQANQKVSNVMPKSQIVIQNEFDEFLGCDQQMGPQITVSQSAKKRRKYQVNKRNVIKQQDQYDQNNSILSQN